MLISVMLGVLVYSVSNISIGGAVAITASFFGIVILFFNKYYSIILMAFFILSIANNFIYYRIDINNQKIFTVRISSIYKYSAEGEVSGRRVKLIGLENRIASGEKCIVKGNFKREIDMNRGIIGTIYVEKTLGVKQDYIFKLKNISRIYYNKLKNIVGEKDSALISSTTLGFTTALTEEQNEDMEALGIIHVISVSGFHIALIFLILDRLVSIKLSIPLCLLYVIITGASSPTVRAFFMILVLKLSKKFYKNYDGLSSLALSALILILYKPYFLFDIGFGLSYLATLGILIMYKPLLRVFYKLPKKINEGVSICFAAQIFTIPYISVTLKQFSLNFLIGNIVVLPLFTPLVIIGNIALVFLWSDTIFSFISKGFYPIMLCIDGAVKISKAVTVPNIYLGENFFYGYLFLLICFYMYYKGFKRFKILSYSVMVYMIIINYSFYPKIIISEEKWNKAVVVEYGFNKTLITNSNNQYFIENIKKQYGIYNITILKDNMGIDLGKGAKLVISRDLKEAYIMLAENKDNNTKLSYYDIITIRNKNNIFRIINGELFTSNF